MSVHHIVYFKFKESASPADVARHMEAFAALSETIPGIVSYSAGKTFAVDYEATGDYDTMHCLKCESQQALESYFHHEAHQNFIEVYKHLWQDVLVVNAQED